MNFLIKVFNTIFFQPIFNLLVLLYHYLPGHDFGIAIIVLTILIRLVLYPLSLRMSRYQRALSNIQLKAAEIKRKFVDDKEREMKEVMELYKKEKVNPLAGFSLFLVQFLILIALYQVFRLGFQSQTAKNLYSFLPQPRPINPLFLGMINLSQQNIVLAVLAGVGQLIQPKETKNNMSKKIARGMVYFSSIFTIIILSRLPAALSLFLIANSLFILAQESFFKTSNLKNVEQR